MKKGAVIMRIPAKRPDILEGSDLVVRRHNRHQNRIRPRVQFVRQFFRAHPAFTVHRKTGYRKAAAFEVLAGMQDGVVFDG